MNNIENSIKLSKFVTCMSLFFLIAILCNSTSLIAQNDEIEIAKIEHTVTSLYTAMVDKNRDVLEGLTMAKLSYGHSSGTIENKSEYVDGVLNGAFQFSSIAPKNQIISIVEEIGVVRHIFNGEGTNNGISAKVNIGCLLIFKKKNNNWKLLARQAFKL